METNSQHLETGVTAKRPDAAALAGLSALRQRVVAREATPETTPAVTPRRESNGQLLQTAQNGRTASDRNRAAEELRRRVKTMCAAALDKYTGQLTAQEAEDLTQEVMIRLFTAANAASADPSKAPVEVNPAYVQRIAVNLLIDQRRRLDRRGLNTLGLSVDDTDTAIALPDPAVQVESEVIGKFHQYQLRAALDAMLSPAEAKVLWLRVGDGLSHAEIAEELGIKEANARKHYERGLKRLRTKLDVSSLGMSAAAI